MRWHNCSLGPLDYAIISVQMFLVCFRVSSKASLRILSKVIHEFSREQFTSLRIGRVLLVLVDGDSVTEGTGLAVDLDLLVQEVLEDSHIENACVEGGRSRKARGRDGMACKIAHHRRNRNARIVWLHTIIHGMLAIDCELELTLLLRDSGLLLQNLHRLHDQVREGVSGTRGGVSGALVLCASATQGVYMARGVWWRVR